MLDFQNLTEQQKEFFTTLWEQHAQQTENTIKSEKSLNAAYKRKTKPKRQRL